MGMEDLPNGWIPGSYADTNGICQIRFYVNRPIVSTGSQS
jgi:hypothetical protein